MADDSVSDEEFVVSCLLLAAARQYTSAVCKCRRHLVWTQSWITNRPRGWKFIHHWHELQTADAQAYRGRRLRPTEIQLLYTSHIGRHITPEHLLKDLSSEGLYRPSSLCCCLQHTLSRPITALRLWKNTLKNRSCANQWKLLSKGENFSCSMQLSTEDSCKLHFDFLGWKHIFAYFMLHVCLWIIVDGAQNIPIFSGYFRQHYRKIKLQFDVLKLKTRKRTDNESQ